MSRELQLSNEERVTSDSQQGTTDQAGQAGRVHQPGGVPKPAEFRNTEGLDLPGMALGGVPKLDELRNILDEVEPADGNGNPRREDVLGVGRAAPAGPSKGGRPTVITPAAAEQLCMLLSIGFSRRQAAAYLGCSPQAITRAVARDPELGEELLRAEELADLQPQMTLMTEARKNWRAAAWYLQFRQKHPRPLSEDEKEERRQAGLGEAPRKVVRKPRRGK